MGTPVRLGSSTSRRRFRRRTTSDSRRRSSGVARLRGHGAVYPAPRDGRTLVLLVDDNAGGRSAVSVRLVMVPVQPRSRVELDSQNAAWNSALQSDPEVRAFMNE